MPNILDKMTNSYDGYVADASSIKGGFLVVENYSALANIPTAVIVVGMLAYCVSDETGHAKGYYQCTAISPSITWEVAQIAGDMNNPMTTAGDLIVGGSSGVPNRLPLGDSGKFLGSRDGVVGWYSLPLGNVYKLQGSATVSDLNSLIKTESMNGDVYNMLGSGTLNNASGTITVNEGDNVVLVWNSGSWYWDKLSATVDLSGYQTLIDSSHKLSADYVDDTSTTNKFVTTTEKNTWNGKSVVSVSDTGTATDEVQYITINGVEKKLPSGGGGTSITPNPESVASAELKKATIGSTVYQVQNVELSDTDYISDIVLVFSDNSSETIEGVLLIENNAIYLEVE